MKKLTFLGTGTSTGIPEIGCACAACTSSDPRDQRLRASALIELNGHTLLIDPGPDFRYQCLRAGVTRLDAILVTHEHYDHVGGLDDIRPLFRGGMPCPIYAEPQVIEAEQMRMPYAFAKNKYAGVPDLILHPVYPYIPLTFVPEVPITPLRVLHGKLPIVGYKIGENLAYITDCKTLPPETIEAIRGIPLLVINALHTYPHPAHLSFGECLELLDIIQPGEAYLTHFAHTFGTHKHIETLCPPHVYPAYDMLTVSI